MSDLGMYILSNLIKIGQDEIVLDNSKALYISSNSISSDSGINFSIPSSDGISFNGKRINTKNLTVFPNKNNIGKNKDINVSIPDGSSVSGILPDPPTNIVAERKGLTEIVVNFIPPEFTGGSHITGYTAIVSYDDQKTKSSNTSPQTSTSKKSPITVSDLIIGNTYKLKVYSINRSDNSELSLESNQVLMATVPSAPTSVTAVAGPDVGEISLSWSEVGIGNTIDPDNGGSEVTEYRIYNGTTYLGSKLKGTSYKVTGLENGKSYTFTVKAFNAAGEGSGKDSNSVTTFDIPSLPTLTATSDTSSEGTVNLSWQVDNNGGTDIQKYKVYYKNTSDTNYIMYKEITSSELTGSLPVSQLQYVDSNYDFYIKAINAVGESNSPIKTAKSLGVPYSPIISSITPEDGKVRLYFQDPTWTGGLPIIIYKVYVYNEDENGNDTLVKSEEINNTNNEINSNKFIFITGLTNGTSYKFSISAINSIGEGSESEKSSSKPFTIPLPPVNFNASPGNQSIDLSWEAPSFDGGSPITGYKVYILDIVSYSNNITINIESTKTSLTIDKINNSIGTLISLRNGTLYNVTIKALNDAGEGYSNEYNIVTELYDKLLEVYVTPRTLPNAPVSVNAVAGPDVGDISLNWSAVGVGNTIIQDNGGSEVTEYRIYRGTTYVDKSIGTNYKVKGLANGTSYTFTVKAFNAAGEGSGKDSNSVSTFDIPSLPTLTATSDTSSEGTVNLSWQVDNNGGTDIQKYKVYYKNTSDTNYIMYKEITSSELTESLKVSQLSNIESNYDFYIKAINAVGESNSLIKTAKSLGVPYRPFISYAYYNDNYGEFRMNFYIFGDGGRSITGINLYVNDVLRTDYNTSSLNEQVDVSIVNDGFYRGYTNIDYLFLENLTAINYNIYVEAINSIGKSIKSNVISFSTNPIDKGDQTLVLENPWYTVYTSPPTVPIIYLKSYLINTQQTYPPPTDILNFKATTDIGSIYLSWDIDTSTTGYNDYFELSYNEHFSSNFTTLKINKLSRSYTIENVSSSKEYYIKISSYNYLFQGSKYADLNIRSKYLPLPPSEVRNLRVVDYKNDTLYIAFEPPESSLADPPEENVTYTYQYYGRYVKLNGLDLNINTEMRDQEGIVTNNTYQAVSNFKIGPNDWDMFIFMIITTNAKGTSYTSLPKDKFPYVPSMPRNLMAISYATEIEFIWDPPSSSGNFPIIGYNVSDQNGNVLGSNIQTTNYKVTGLKPGTIYTYYIIARNIVGDSPYTTVSPRTLYPVASNYNIGWHNSFGDNMGFSPYIDITAPCFADIFPGVYGSGSFIKFLIKKTGDNTIEIKCTNAGIRRVYTNNYNDLIIHTNEGEFERIRKGEIGTFIIPTTEPRRQNGYTYGIKQNGDVYSIDRNNHSNWLGINFSRIRGEPSYSEYYNTKSCFYEYKIINYVNAFSDDLIDC